MASSETNALAILAATHNELVEPCIAGALSDGFDNQVAKGIILLEQGITTFDFFR